MTIKEARPRVLIAISGEGSTAHAVLEAKRRSVLPGIDIVGIMASSSEQNTGKALRRDINKYDFLGQDKMRVINPSDFKNEDGSNDHDKYGDAILSYMNEVGASSIAQLGFAPDMPQNVVESARWVINQHPGPLDPGRIDAITKEQLDFGGKGMKGAAVTVARLAYVWATGKEYWTESTVHFISSSGKHDKNKLISVARLDIPWATPSVSGWAKPPTIGQIWESYHDELRHSAREVHAELLPVENANVIEALKQFENGAIPEGFMRDVPLVKPGQGREYILFRAKDLAEKIAPVGKSFMNAA